MGNENNGMRRVQFINSLKAIQAFYTTHDYESSIRKMMDAAGWDREMAEMCYETLDNGGVEGFGVLLYETLEGMGD